MDLRDFASEIDRIASGLIVAHPTYKNVEAGNVEPEDLRGFLADLGSADVMLPQSSGS